MKRVLVMMAALLFASPGMGDEFFKWTDERGVVHITNVEPSVPEEHREDVERKVMPVEREASSGSTREPTGPTEKTTEQPKDRFGRGRDFWVTWTNEARNRLTRAEDDYNRLQVEYKQTLRDLDNATSTAQREECRNRMESLKVDMERRREDIRKAKEELEIKIPEAAKGAGGPAEWVR